MTTMTRPVGAHLVGSVPLADAADVFRTAADVLGRHLDRIPDGETGERTEWIHFQIPVFADHPQLEPIHRERPGRGSVPTFRLRAGVDAGDVTFGDLGYAAAAEASYATFRELRDAGAIPPAIRFQVSLPTPAAPISSWIDPHERAALEPAYEAALTRDLDRMLDAIPREDLALQWDVCNEVLLIEDAPGFDAWFDDVWSGVIERLTRLAAHVPDDVPMGMHFCYGDYKHTHLVEIDDTTHLVELANVLAERIERRLDWLHLPVPRDRDADRYLAPLADHGGRRPGGR